MTTVAIELNDTGLLPVGETGERGAASPGYALLDGKELIVGAEAQARARLKPRWVDHRFWQWLDTEAMPKPFPRTLSRADVAHAHLSSLWEGIRRDLGGASGTEVLLAIPGSFAVAQLGLILGVARAAEMSVVGMVDAAVAAATTRPVSSRVLHLEITLHRTVWTELEHRGELARRRLEVLESGGLAAVWDAWAKHIARLLVRRTRFDPFHHGRAEQTLYDSLPMWLAELAEDGSVLVSLESDDKEYAVELGAADVEQVSAGLLAAVLESARALAPAGDTPTWLVSATAASVPGLLSPLRQLAAAEIGVLDIGAAACGALEHRQHIVDPGDDLPFTLRLPAEGRTVPLADPASPGAATVPSSSRGPAPTHVLFEGLAWPIDQQPLWIGSAPEPDERGLAVGGPMPGLSRRHCTLVVSGSAVILEDRSRYGTYLNERRVDGRVEVAVGDRIRLGSPGVELQLIAMAQEDV